MRATLLLAGALWLGGCAAPVVSLAPPQSVPALGDYGAVLQRWTRHGNIRADFDEVLSVDATLFGPEMRAAHTARWCDRYRLTGSDAEQVRDKAAERDATAWELHIESASHAFNGDTLKGARSVWRISLVDESGRSVTPSEVTLLHDTLETNSVFYPHATSFTRAWTLRFPKLASDGAPLVGPRSSSVTLRIAGPQGSTDLVWKLEPR
jgi:hypothetical protein